mmetsp:Transcript_19194/g.24907  ORF Transcript_19194/g.24907 Transcript_19194/m.24907 type:complete len:290 (+) Transcript_19194:19-888(+)|eukprot:CAMPEP_0197304584 /NCGR_PEP_ID=MMETSP0891-20130614/103_1 /TAXON_ID=44058 ORGANISM="Aureoumbra lagunensis, Strain CCMP1510" /NCGR_SAMPLE_ID=MMETSP0891 /ASSEMBLY_ACC=CAM_ASM_000534 /LENGTH=289 /DNA_ID=CAMNT_0042784665 /DNA_START=12 /DNA_END=881 /DNA_ORIENTATION=-
MGMRFVLFVCIGMRVIYGLQFCGYRQNRDVSQRMGRWDPPSSRPEKNAKIALNDLRREINAVESGALLADERSKIVELPRGATGIEWGSDLSFVGVYIRALEEGGAAYATGLVDEGDQLVAINGTAAYMLSFDEVMSLLGREAPTIRLEFFSGSRDQLLTVAGIEQTPISQELTVTVLDNDRVIARLPAQRGANLRDVLVQAGIDLYQGSSAYLNCRGKQLCGTCIIDVQQGANYTNRKSNDEFSTLNLQNTAPSCRLSCVTFLYGDITVSLRPERSGFIGAATSGSAW